MRGRNYFRDAGASVAPPLGYRGATEEASLAATGETPEVADSDGNQVGPESPTLLQELLPEINDLAQRVGGFDHLAEIIEALRHTNQE